MARAGAARKVTRSPAHSVRNGQGGCAGISAHVSRCQRHGGQLFRAQRIYLSFHGLLVVQNDGFPVCGLIAGSNQTVQGKRIGLGCDPLLFEQTTENSCLNGCKIKQGRPGLLARYNSNPNLCFADHRHSALSADKYRAESYTYPSRLDEKAEQPSTLPPLPPPPPSSPPAAPLNESGNPRCLMNNAAC